MLLPIPPIRRRRSRRFDPAVPATPPATVNVNTVAVDHGSEFNWVVYWEFSGDLPPDLPLAALAGLTVAGGGPSAVEDADANWLMLVYHTDGAAGETWLVRPGGSPVFVPGQTGIVGEL